MQSIRPRNLEKPKASPAVGRGVDRQIKSALREAYRRHTSDKFSRQALKKILP